MNVTRLITAGICAALTTVVLVVVMFKLVDKEWLPPEEVDKRKIADIRMPDREIETQYDTSKPDKPDEPEEAPDIPEPDFDAPDVSADAVNIAQPVINTDIAVGFGNNFKSDGEYLPIVRVEPRYPTNAASRGIEGWVIVEFTVTSNGSVKDPIIIENDPSSIFDREARRAVLKWKYKPRVIDGNPVEVPGVRTKLVFNLAD
ncbi:hypothetical protein NBRC116493_28410 [Aurantivibrio infirmus]